MLSEDVVICVRAPELTLGELAERVSAQLDTPLTLDREGPRERYTGRCDGEEFSISRVRPPSPREHQAALRDDPPHRFDFELILRQRRVVAGGREACLDGAWDQLRRLLSEAGAQELVMVSADAEELGACWVSPRAASDRGAAPGQAERGPSERRAPIDLDTIAGQTLERARLRDLDLGGARLVGVVARHLDALRCCFDGVDASEADFAHARLEASTAVDARFDRAKLTAASLAGLEATHASFVGAQAESSNFDGATLTGASFRDADLRGATLAGADLRGVDFRGADLRQAWLSGADLRGAKLDGARLEQAEFEGARWADPAPLSQRIEAAWATAEAALDELEGVVSATMAKPDQRDDDDE